MAKTPATAPAAPPVPSAAGLLGRIAQLGGHAHYAAAAAYVDRARAREGAGEAALFGLPRLTGGLPLLSIAAVGKRR